MQPCCASPVHTPWPGNLLDGARKHFFQNLFCQSPVNYLLRGNVLPLGRCHEQELFDWESVFLCKAFSRPSWLAAIVEGRGLRRPHHFLGFVILLYPHVCARRGEPPRRGKCLNTGISDQVVGGQIFFKYYFKFL